MLELGKVSSMWLSDCCGELDGFPGQDQQVELVVIPPNTQTTLEASKQSWPMSLIRYLGCQRHILMLNGCFHV